MKWLNNYRIRSVMVGAVAVAMLSSRTVRADFVFGEPENLGPTVNSSAIDNGPSISADGLTLFFVSRRPGGEGNNDIWMTERPTTDEPWGTPVNLGPTVNSSYHEHGPQVSPDDLKLYFSSQRPSGEGGNDIWMTERPTTSDLWGMPVNLGPTVNSSDDDAGGSITADGLELFLSSGRSGGSGHYDLWSSTRATTQDSWGEPVNLGPIVNSTATDAAPDISADGLMLFFASNRLGGIGDRDLWVAMRATTSDEWSTPVNLGSTVNGTGYDSAPEISADGRTLYFFSDRPGGEGDRDLWQAPIIPIVDFNGDGIVDSADMVIMIDNWGTDDSRCDIGPMPWGDGVVDVEDLKVLAEHLFEEPRLAACWKLDEAEGDTALDSVSGIENYVIGGPSWRPNEGMVDGAIELDGIDDYIITHPVLNPADGPFSVYAWIKGGGPGQVMVSQQLISDWLALDEEGRLMTNIQCELDLTGPLVSDTVITDGQWHHVGLVWDGEYRMLCVDGVTVAEDRQISPVSSGAGLSLGVSKDFATGTFFSGLIDDVRIYNRAIMP